MSGELALNLDLEMERFNKVIREKEIRTVFQPIINLKDGQILGYEALSRGPKGSELESPAKLFSLAKKYQKVFSLEKVCRERALLNAQDLEGKYKIFINVDPYVICDQEFRAGMTKEIIEQFSISQKDIVIEITEKSSIEDFEKFKSVLEHYRKQGYKIAIDDTGAGYSGLQSIVSISYNYMKLDRSLIQNIDQDLVKQHLLETFMLFAKKIDSKVIAEGIERKEELDILIEMGVDYGQGFFIARPEEKFQNNLEIVDYIIAHNKDKSGKMNGSTIGEIAKEEAVVTLKTKNKGIANLFEVNEQLQSVVVLKDSKPVGLVMRDKLYSRLGSKYGYSIFIDRGVELIMDKNLLIVDAATSISEVSQRAMNRPLSNVYDSIVVVNDGHYLGIVTIRKLLDKITDLQIEQAKDLNPLTKLPGNHAIEEEISRRVKNDELFSVLYLDLDNFKPYNDHYGYKKGDEVINFTANLLEKTVAKTGTRGDFVGHIGGDDFIVITTPKRDKMIAKAIVEGFDQGIVDFFNEEDRKKGAIVAKNRQGIVCEQPLTSISIAIVSNEKRKIKNHLEVSDIATELKKAVKRKKGSNFMKDSRKK